MVEQRSCPSGYTPETWAAKQAEVAEFSRRDPFKDPHGERRANAEARLRAAMCIQCADVPDQFALVRRGDLITLLGDFTRYRAGFEIWRDERAARTASVDTHAKRGDSTQIEAPSPMGSAVPKADAHTQSAIK